jgi:hypothetical protein
MRCSSIEVKICMEGTIYIIKKNKTDRIKMAIQIKVNKKGQYIKINVLYLET